MHNIEPHYRWRDHYTAESDDRSPFFGRKYSEFYFRNQLYNFYLHPQWDEFGSSTLYCKILFADYEENFALIELIGEWNDALHNDVMYLKRNIADRMYDAGIYKFIFLCDNVLNFHSANEDDYYAEWAEEVHEERGWIVLLNTRQHVEEEMQDARLQLYAHFGEAYNEIPWQAQKPHFVYHMIENMVSDRVQRIAG